MARPFDRERSKVTAYSLGKAVGDNVRQDSAWVAENADHVFLHRDKISAYGGGLLSRYPLVTEMDAENHFVDRNDAEKTAAYFLALDSINFGSGYFADAKQMDCDLEYAPIAKSLKQAFIAEAMDTPQKWIEANAGDMHHVFGLPCGVSPDIDQLMGLFARHLNATGKAVQDDHSGSIAQFLNDAKNSAMGIVGLVAHWPHFHDVHAYKGRKVAVYKRAQILAADLHLALGGFDDVSGLTIFADNMVPHVLRQDGIISYRDGLASKIDAAIPLMAGSAEEVELRSIAIHAVELIKAALHDQGHAGVSSMNIDHLLWHRGYEEGFSDKPVHRTRTVWY